MQDGYVWVLGGIFWEAYAFIQHTIAGLGPHGKIINIDTVARGAVWADDIDGTASHAVRTRSFPVCKVEILILHSVAWLEFELRPVPVDV